MPRGHQPPKVPRHGEPPKVPRGHQPPKVPRRRFVPGAPSRPHCQQCRSGPSVQTTPLDEARSRRTPPCTTDRRGLGEPTTPTSAGEHLAPGPAPLPARLPRREPAQQRPGRGRGSGRFERRRSDPPGRPRRRALSHRRRSPMPRIRQAPTRAMGQGNRRTAPRARLLSKRRRRLRCALPPPPARPRRSSRHLRPRWLTATSAFHQTLQRTVARCGSSRPSLVPQQGCWRRRSHRLGQHSGEREPVCSQAFLRRCRRPSLRRCRRPRHRRCRRPSL